MHINNIWKNITLRLAQSDEKELSEPSIFNALLIWTRKQIFNTFNGSRSLQTTRKGYLCSYYTYLLMRDLLLCIIKSMLTFRPNSVDKAGSVLVTLMSNVLCKLKRVWYQHSSSMILTFIRFICYSLLCFVSYINPLNPLTLYNYAIVKRLTVGGLCYKQSSPRIFYDRCTLIKILVVLY